MVVGTVLLPAEDGLTLQSCVLERDGRGCPVESGPVLFSRSVRSFHTGPTRSGQKPAYHERAYSNEFVVISIV